MDSLTTGIGLSAITSNFIEASSIFMVISGLFTYIGLKLGNKLEQNFGSMSINSSSVLRDKSPPC